MPALPREPPVFGHASIEIRRHPFPDERVCEPVRVPVNGARTPAAAERTSDTLPIELLGDRLGITTPIHPQPLPIVSQLSAERTCLG